MRITYRIADARGEWTFEMHEVVDAVDAIAALSAAARYTMEPDRELLETPIHELKIGVRAKNCLESGDINTLGSLLKQSAANLLKMRNMGQGTVQEIEVCLKAMGLHLAVSAPQKQPLWQPPADPGTTSAAAR